MESNVWNTLVDKNPLNYDETADSYAKMMDAEIELPVYADVLGRLHQHIKNI